MHCFIDCTDFGVSYNQRCYIFNSNNKSWMDQRSQCEFLKVENQIFNFPF